MIYRDFQGMKLSALGFGAMRLPVFDGDDGRIDEEAALRMVDTAMKNGINYYDTAWDYHSGNSELVLGKALSAYPREVFYLATKFPGYDASNWGKAEEIFERQLEKLGVDYFDFYLFHNVCEMNIDAYLDDEKYGIYSYLMKQKENGRIRHLGFSCHGSLPVLRRFLDAYGKDMEFCQLQLNYLDWNFQNGKDKVALLDERNIPVWVMEPLRGGKLAHLSPEYEKELKGLRPDEKIPAWAFRFLQTLPEVKMILSGMSNEEQLHANINCPAGLDIPHLIELYNEHILTTKAGLFGFIAPMAMAAVPAEKQPAACLHCRSCEQVCPQQIRVSEVLEDFVKVLGQ